MRPDKIRPLLLVTVATLPISYVPLEFAPGSIAVQSLSLVLVVLCAIRYRAFRGHWTGVEMAAWLLLVWIVIRLAILGPVEGRPSDILSLISAVAGIFAGITMLRIARQEDLRRTVIRGLRISLLLMVGWEMYQVAAGLPKLLSLGYIAPEFNYNTASGEYRPFSFFKTPVVYGTYLAMVSAAVVFSARGFAIWFYGIIAAVGLFFTETRSAWIALGVAIVIACIIAPPQMRRRLSVAIVPLAFLVTFFVLLRPDIVTALGDRLGTVFDLGYNSNSIRLVLWDGTLQAFTQRPIEGYGAESFVEALTPIIDYAYASFAHPHSNYLQVMFLYGSFGLIFFVAMLLTGFRATMKKGGESNVPRVAGTAALAAFVITSFFESTWTVYNVMVALLMCVGLGMLPVSRPGNASPLAPRAAPLEQKLRLERE